MSADKWPALLAITTDIDQAIRRGSITGDVVSHVLPRRQEFNRDRWPFKPDDEKWRFRAESK
jgi:hypothetical protein